MHELLQVLISEPTFDSSKEIPKRYRVPKWVDRAVDCRANGSAHQRLSNRGPEPKLEWSRGSRDTYSLDIVLKGRLEDSTLKKWRSYQSPWTETINRCEDSLLTYPFTVINPKKNDSLKSNKILKNKNKIWRKIEIFVY